MRRSAIATLLVGVYSVTVLLGCAQHRQDFSDLLGRFPGRKVETLPPGSLAGRIEAIESLTERADSLPPGEVTQAVQRLTPNLRPDSPAAVRLVTIRALGRLRDPQSVDALRALIGDNDPQIREEVCRSLGRLNEAEAHNLLTQLAQHDPDVDVRLAAVRALGNYSNPRTVQALGQILNDQDPAVQYVAMQALEEVSGEDLGPDVRRWKEFTQDPEAIMASRVGASTQR